MCFILLLLIFEGPSSPHSTSWLLHFVLMMGVGGTMDFAVTGLVWDPVYQFGLGLPGRGGLSAKTLS